MGSCVHLQLQSACLTLKIKLQYAFHINTHSHQRQFWRGGGGGGKWGIYTLCIDFPKSALAANQFLVLLVLCSQCHHLRRERSGLFFSSSLFISFWIQHFYPIGEKEISIVQKSFWEDSHLPVFPPSLLPAYCLSPFLAVIVSRANRCLH